MKISVIGCGYVGLVTAACFSDFGHDVFCMDNQEEKIKKLNEGIIPIYEENLDQLLNKNLKEDKLIFSLVNGDIIEKSEAIFIAVGTPMDINGDTDLTILYDCIQDIKVHLKKGRKKTLIIKSTIPVGTCENIKSMLNDNQDYEIDVVSNPEFLREGSAIKDFMNPDRIVIGTDNQRSIKLLKTIYKKQIDLGHKVIFTNIKSAEIAKYASNSFLAMKVSFINEISDLCETTGADIDEVRNVIGSDKRIGDKFLEPGPGYGGSCFPKDLSSLVNIAKSYGNRIEIIEQVIESNDYRKVKLANRIISKLNLNEISNVTVLGVSFKAGTDDVRDSPAIPIIQQLIRKDINLVVHDPMALTNFSKLYPNINTALDLYDAVRGADILVILTEWSIYRKIDISKLAKLMKGNKIFDFRNIYSREKIIIHGFEYECLGR
ncbi:MAG: UDP-glucose/GDP-mannose dehydrogenase family protein [Hyphomicrobiales bacterium]|nr:UDP-glucose/GDP-mannose dehydrogenase family protein [Hyphomicrobiales bacterium]